MREFACRRIEFTAANRIETIGHHAAIETGHVAVDRDRLGRPFGGEPWRQKKARGRIACLGRFDSGSRRFLRLHGQRFKALPARAVRRRRCRGCRWWRGAAPGPGGWWSGRGSRLRRRNRSTRRESELEVDRLIARRARDRDRTRDRGEAGELGCEIVGSERERDAIRAVRICRGGHLDGTRTFHEHRHARKRRCTAQRAAADPARSLQPAARRRPVLSIRTPAHRTSQRSRHARGVRHRCRGGDVTAPRLSANYERPSVQITLVGKQSFSGLAPKNSGNSLKMSQLRVAALCGEAFTLDRGLVAYSSVTLTV